MSGKTRGVLAVLILPIALGLVGCTAEATPNTAPKGGSDVAARIGDTEITLEAVDDAARATNTQAYQALYDARRAALDRLIADQLIETEAKARSVSVEALVEQEITAKIEAVTDSDVSTFFNANQQRMRGRTVEQMTGQIRTHLSRGRGQHARTRFVDELKKKYAVKISLDPPRTPVEIAENDPVRGPDSAPVKIIEFSDFQ